MPCRPISALLALLIALFSAAPTLAAPGAGWVTSPGAEVRFQDDGLAEDQFSAFSMPGLTSDNLTDMVLGDIDGFWAAEMSANGVDYYAAGTVPVTDVVTSACGDFGPYDNPAAYCALDDTVYVSLPLGQEIRTTIGDFAWIAILAHEWGHHVQRILGIEPTLSIDRELQADCFSGAYARRALQQGFLQEGDLTEAMVITVVSADPIELDDSAQGAHGSSDSRVTAFFRGYLEGSPV
jgi:predicted metalloprotease